MVRPVNIKDTRVSLPVHAIPRNPQFPKYKGHPCLLVSKWTRTDAEMHALAQSHFPLAAAKG